MTIFIGIILFIVGTLAAFVAAIAGIAYLRTLSVYIGMRRLYRVSFGVGMLAIAALISTLIAQMLLSGSISDVSEDIAALSTPAEEFQLIEEDADTKVEIAETPKEEASESEVEAKSEGAEEEVAEAPVQPVAEQPAQPATEQQPAQPVAEQPAVARSQIAPSFSVWSNIYKGHEYAYIEVENGVPYVYAPNNRGSFWYDLNNISSGRESGNIVVMANAGLFDTSSLVPLGTTIQNGKVVSSATSNSGIPRTLVVDDGGNVGYATNSAGGAISSYTDAVTGETVTGRKIVSAVYGFGPVMLNDKTATKYKDKVAKGYRARQMFCVRAKNNYMIISNTGEGEDGGGWDFDDMAEVARRRGCVSAFSLDGGGSTALAWRTSVHQDFSTYATTERNEPTFIVFTADNLAPSGK